MYIEKKQKQNGYAYMRKHAWKNTNVEKKGKLHIRKLNTFNHLSRRIIQVSYEMPFPKLYIYIQLMTYEKKKHRNNILSMNIRK